MIERTFQMDNCTSNEIPAVQRTEMYSFYKKKNENPILNNRNFYSKCN